MHVLAIARERIGNVEERWSKLGIGSTYVAPGQLLQLLNSPLERQHLMADALVFLCGRVSPITGGPDDFRDVIAAVDLMYPVRELHESIAMPDGRRWSALPALILAASAAFAQTHHSLRDVLARGGNRVHELTITDDFAASTLKADVKQYRQNVLNELDNLGFVVTYDGGRYRIGPALKPRPELVGHYYFGPADRRLDHFVTIDRDLVGIQLEVELLEALINNRDVSERHFQAFFEEYPHFLSELAVPMPHVQLRDELGKLLVPDFILKPVVATQRDSRWEVLDLKQPQASLIVGKGSRRRLSHEVQQAIRQLRDYGDYFADPRNARTIEQTLGHQLRRPKLGVLIGRMPEPEIEVLELEQSRLPDVRIITYDEILQQQKRLVS